MPSSTGAWAPNSTTNQRMRLRVDYTVPTPQPGQTSITVSGSVWVEARYSFNDVNNSFTWSGSLPGTGSKSASINVATDGSQRIHTFSQSVPVGATTSSRNFSFALTGIDYVGSSVRATVSGSVAIPARAGDPPATPTNLQVSGLDTMTLTASWSGSADRFEVQRTTVTGAWWTLGDAVSGNSHSYTTIGGDQRLQYRVRGLNSVGASAWATTGYLYTTPAKATGVKVTRSATVNTTVTVTWTRNAAYIGKQDVESSSRTPGGSWSSWSPHAGATGLHSSVSSRSITDLDASLEWRFRIRTDTPSPTVSAYSDASNAVGLVGPPAAPTITSPTGTVSTATGALLKWEHNPSDGTEQTEARWSLSGPTSNSGTVTTASQVALGQLPAGSYTVKVATRGEHASFGPDATATFTVAAPPVMSILSPTNNETIKTDKLRAQLSFNGGSGSRFTWTLKKGTVTVEEFEGAWTNGVVAPTTTLEDGASYTLSVKGTAGNGLSSATVVRAFSVAFPRPTAPWLEAVWDDEAGVVEVVVTSPPPEMVELEPGLWSVSVTMTTTTSGAIEFPDAQVSQLEPGLYDLIMAELVGPTLTRVERREAGGEWVELATLTPDGTYLDAMAPIGVELEYRAVAITSLGVEGTGNVVALVAASDTAWFTGADGTVLRLLLDQEYGIDRGHERVVEHYLGRELPTSYYGVGRPVSIKVSGAVVEGFGLGTDWRHLLGQDVYARLPARWSGWASLTEGGVATEAHVSRLERVSFTMEAVNHG